MHPGYGYLSLGELIQHAINHSTYHRGQIALLIRQLGYVPASTDYHDFLAEWRAGST
ncbi:MAG: DinB family protein [Acidobacteriaceae bacterium]